MNFLQETFGFINYFNTEYKNENYPEMRNVDLTCFGCMYLKYVYTGHMKRNYVRLGPLDQFRHEIAYIANKINELSLTTILLVYGNVHVTNNC